MKKSVFKLAAAGLTLALLITITGCNKKTKIVIPEINDGFILVEGGSFTMGSDAKVKWGYYSHDAHETSVDSFFFDPYLVTQKDFEELMGYNPSKFLGEDKWTKLPEGESQEMRPVEKVEWYEMVAYCNRKSIAEGLEPVYSIMADADLLEEGVEADYTTDPDLWGDIPGAWSKRWNGIKWDETRNGYRLPTEAEWEYAAKGGTAQYETGYPEDADIGDYEWYSKNAGGMTHAVGMKLPNNLGLYDMNGNVYVGCWDWFDTKYYSKAEASEANPKGSEPADYRVARGGYWDASAYEMAPYIRGSASPNKASIRGGLRLARSNIDYVARAEAEKLAAEEQAKAEKEAKKAAKKNK